jgi:hypothetical protein
MCWNLASSGDTTCNSPPIYSPQHLNIRSHTFRVGANASGIDQRQGVALAYAEGPASAGDSLAGLVPAAAGKSYSHGQVDSGLVRVVSGSCSSSRHLHGFVSPGFVADLLRARYKASGFGEVGSLRVREVWGAAECIVLQSLHIHGVGSCGG